MSGVDPDCSCKCINAFNIPGVGLRGCKDYVHCGREQKGCRRKRGDAWAVAHTEYARALSYLSWPGLRDLAGLLPEL